MKVMHYWMRWFPLTCAVLALTALSACGGGGLEAGLNGPALAPSGGIGDGLDWSQAQRAGSFAVLAVSADERSVDPRTAQLELAVTETRTGP